MLTWFVQAASTNQGGAGGAAVATQPLQAQQLRAIAGMPSSVTVSTARGTTTSTGAVAMGGPAAAAGAGGKPACTMPTTNTAMCQMGMNGRPAMQPGMAMPAQLAMQMMQVCLPHPPPDRVLRCAHADRRAIALLVVVYESI